MKSYFFFIHFCYLIVNSAAFSQISVSPSYSNQGVATQAIAYPLAYPAIKISPRLAELLFLDQKRNLLNCPVLFDNSWNYPSGSSIALCDDAQLACLRYGLIIEAIKNATGRYRSELEETLVISKAEVTLRLRGCHLALKETASGKSIEEAAGYPTSVYGSSGTYGPAAQ